MDLSQTPGDRLKKARQRRGLTKGQVCDAVDCGRVTLWRWEEGKTTIAAADLAKLSDLYGVSMDVLWFGERRPAPPRAADGREGE